MDYWNLDINTLIISERETASHYHFAVGRMWRLVGLEKKLHVPLSYSAFEFRLAIERYLFEYFFLIRHRRGFSKKEERECSSITRLIKAIYNHEGGRDKFYKRMKFNLHCITADPNLNDSYKAFPNGFPTLFSLDDLHSYWIKLSEYCHRQLEPEETWKSKGEVWVNNGYNLLFEIENHLSELFKTNSHCWFSIDAMEEEYKDLNDKFCSNLINEEELRNKLLMLSKRYSAKS